jgi:hypothetical protein
MSEDASNDSFFQPDGLRASFGYWARMGKWTEEEAVSLLLGLNPAYTKSEAQLSYRHARPHAAKYLSLRKLAHRATDQKHIAYPYTPARWLKWAKECGLPMPPVLEDNIVKWDGASGSSVSADRARIVQLEAQLAEVTARANAPTPKSKGEPPTIGTRERETMLKLIIAMAIKGYSYDPKAKRGDRINEIVSDLENCGVPLSDDTVRRYLREAIDLLPPEEI